MLDWLLKKDTELFLFLNNLGSETWDQFWLVITHEYTFAPLYGLLLFLIYKKYGLKPLLCTVVVVAALITFSDQMTNVFKDTFMRPRPCRAESIMDHVRFIAVRCGKYGFFSGHSSNSMAAAIFGGLMLRPYFKGIMYYLIIWSCVVGYSRIYLGVHYPLDVICGLSFGAISGFLFYQLNKYLIKRFIYD